MNTSPLLKVKDLGQSLWLDDMRRDMLDNGELTRWIQEEGLAGMTSNPTIFEKDIIERHAYDPEIERLASRGYKPGDLYEELALEDVRRAADLFAGVFRATDGRDGFVSLEVSPRLAHDTEATIAEARRLWTALARPNVMIKVPGTLAGLPALRSLISEGINVNVTLLFSVDRYREVVDHFMAGLEDRRSSGLPLGRIASVASFFLSRIDTLVDRLLDRCQATGGVTQERIFELRGETAIASARLAYRAYQHACASPRWEALHEAGARSQRLLWASTSTKDPRYSDVKYVEALIGSDTVNTLPLDTLQAFRDHGRAEARLEHDFAWAERVFEGLSDLGTDLARVTEQLEQEGIHKFAASYEKLLQALSQRRESVNA